MQIQENIILAPYTTFKIGGPAEYFALVKTLEELQEALAWAKEKEKEVFVFGGGSNLLISDNGIKGLVIKLDLQRLEFNDNKVIVGAGVNLAYLLNQALENNLTGLEFAAGIPGTVGGAIRGNAGTYGVAMGDVVTAISYLDKENQLKIMFKNEADFAYRHSIFKVNNYLIVEAELLLTKGDVAASRALIQERLTYRKGNHPNQPSAGCIFKNIDFREDDVEALRAKGIEIDKFLEHKKIPAGYLIEKAELKGKTIGQAQVSPQHANYIINLGQAKAEDVMILTSLIKQQIRDKFGLQLEEEVQFVV